METLRSLPIRIRFLYQYYCMQMSAGRSLSTPTGGFIYNFYRSLFSTILTRLLKKDIGEIKAELIEVFGERCGRTIKSDIKNIKPCVKVLLTDLRAKGSAADSDLPL